MKILLMLALVLGAATGCGSRQWTKTSTVLELAVAASMFVDHAQTQQITRDGRESNPFMGLHGERIAPEIYFPMAMVAHVVVAALLPMTVRHMFQSATLGVQGKAITQNALEGYGIQ